MPVAAVTRPLIGDMTLSAGQTSSLDETNGVVRGCVAFSLVQLISIDLLHYSKKDAPSLLSRVDVDTT